MKDLGPKWRRLAHIVDPARIYACERSRRNVPKTTKHGRQHRTGVRR